MRRKPGRQRSNEAAAAPPPPSSSKRRRKPEQKLAERQQQQPEKQQRRRQPSSSSSYSSILDDGHGRVNPDLAATLYKWEQQQNPELPKLSFSTRQGLRLVDEIVNSIAESPRGQKFLKGNDDTIRTDLVQEGVMALMDALSDYRRRQQQEQQKQSASSNDNGDGSSSKDDDGDNNNNSRGSRLADQNQRFEAFARPYLEDRLWSTLDKNSRPFQLPETESHVWKHIQKIRPQLQRGLGGRMPTTKELAARLEIPEKTLELLLAAKRGTLSMESTVEIKNPDSLEDQTAHFTDQEEWEEREGRLLDTGKRILKDELVDEYQDEMYQYEGEDEMWIHQEQIAAPLRDIIPDDDDYSSDYDGPSPDDLALSDMIRHDVGEFLTKTLTPDEVQVVRMSFGLDNAGEPMQWEEIGQIMGLQAAQVKEILKESIVKLRTNYRTNYVETTYMDEEHDFYGEDSV